MDFPEAVWLETFRRKYGIVPTRLWVDPATYKKWSDHVERIAMRERIELASSIYSLPEPTPSTILTFAGIPVHPR
jgi:hypothetical protein